MADTATDRRTLTVEAVTEALRDAILDGAVPPGSRLVEREVVERFGVSRVTARQALRTLAAEGLVAIRPNAGARVASLDETSLRGLFELRTALEVEAARLARQRAATWPPEPLRRAVEHLSEVAATDAPAWHDITAAHEGVHAALVAAAGSPRLAAAHAALTGELRLFMLELRLSWSAARTAEHHRRLLAELEADGPEAVRRHLEEGRAAVLEQLRRRERDSRA